MAHLRVFRHSFHSQFLILGSIEFVLLIGSVYVAAWVRLGWAPGQFWQLLPSATTFAAIMVVSTLAMGVYPAYLREGFTGMMLRTAVGFFLLGSIALSLIYYALPALILGRGVLAVSALVGFAAVSIMRWMLVRRSRRLPKPSPWRGCSAAFRT